MSRIRFLILMLMGASLVGTNAAYGSVARSTEIRLKSWTMVSEADVTVSDFLEVDAPEELRQAYSKVRLGKAPGPDQKIKFALQFVASAISQITPPPGYKLNIPNTLVAEGRGLLSSFRFAKERFRQDLVNRCFGLCEVELSWDLPKNLKSEPTDSYFVYGGPTSTVFPRKSFTQALELVRSNSDRLQIWVQGDVHAPVDAVVAKRFLQVGWRVQEEDIDIRTVDYSTLSDTPVTKSSLVGKKLGRNIGPGAVITAGAMERDLAVRFGQTVKGVILSDNWQISFEGVARDSGSVGDRVKIYNPATKKLMSGILSEEGVVEIR